MGEGMTRQVALDCWPRTCSGPPATAACREGCTSNIPLLTTRQPPSHPKPPPSMSSLSRSLLAASIRHTPSSSMRLAAALVRAAGLRSLHLTSPRGKTQLASSSTSSSAASYASKRGEQTVGSPAEEQRVEKAEQEVRDMSRIDDLLNEIGRSDRPSEHLLA